MRKLFSGFWASLSLCLTLLSSGCPESEQAPEQYSDLTQRLRRYDESDDCDGKQVRIAFFSTVPENLFDAAELEGLKAQAQRMKATVTPFYSNFDASLQLSQCNQAVSSGKFDALVILPVDSTAIIPCVTNAKQKKIPVVATQLAIGPDPTTVEPQVPGQVGAVVTPAAKYGKEVAKVVLEQCGTTAKCNVVLLAGALWYQIDSLAQQEIQNLAQAHPNIKLVTTREAFWDAGLAQGAMADILTQTRDIQVVVTSGDQMTLGAERALSAAQVAPMPKLFGAGAGVLGIDAVKAGRWTGTFVVLPFDEGWLAGQMAIRAARGRRIKDPGIDAVEERGYPAFFTTTNQSLFKNFTPQWQG